ncbi:hypothetical protein [Pelagibius sp. Alg239-R121]|uniref:hypothetical protein n=1 Tax=Pelagibius sp. Alg239-R121 TaxID=2993448 RepID=UPI0024A68F62|nr:hypothetical protein [Pelagibius sp. Alg239-R121]
MSNLATIHNFPRGNQNPDLGAAPACTLKSVEEAERAERWWLEQWSAFPTYSVDAEGTSHYWDVPDDSGVYQDDWPLGEKLAEDTIRQMRRFPEGSTVLRHILREIDQTSTIAQGFLNRLEDVLISPELYAKLEK